MRRYFGREPRYTREEIEQQAQEAIDARISLGRPPAEDFLPIERRLAEMDRAQVGRPQAKPVARPQPLQIREVRAPTPPAPAAPASEPPARRQPVAARQSAN